MQNIKLIGDALANARHAAGLSQRDLAGKVGAAQSSVAKLEQGTANPTMETLVRFADALDCEWRIELVPKVRRDPVVERYKRDVDRTSLRENLTRSPDERLRSL